MSAASAASRRPACRHDRRNSGCHAQPDCCLYRTQCPQNVLPPTGWIARRSAGAHSRNVFEPWSCYSLDVATYRVSCLESPMRPPRIHRMLASLVALMLLVIGARSAQATTYRSGDGEVRTTCCCPQDDAADDDDDRGTVIDPACCCDVELGRLLPSVDVRLGSDGASSHELIAVPVFHEVWVAAVVDTSQRWVVPEYVLRRTGPPLRFVKQSFLI